MWTRIIECVLALRSMSERLDRTRVWLESVAISARHRPYVKDEATSAESAVKVLHMWGLFCRRPCL